MSAITAHDPVVRRSPPVDRPISAAIGIARVICILGIVYVHGWTGLDGGQLAALAGSPQGVLRWTMVELFGRSAVPLLSLISGWLVMRSAQRRGYGELIGGKLRAIVAPMVAWNLIALILVCGAAMASWIAAPVPSSIAWTLNEIFCYASPADINVQMAFLRDLFLCMLAVPLFLRLPSKALIALGALTTVWIVGGWMIPILLRPQILLFFLGGILAGRHGLAERLATISPVRAVLPFVLILPLKLALSIWGDRMTVHDEHLIAIVDLAMRFAAAVMVWRLAILLATRPAGKWLGALEPYVFLMFCSHVIFMWLLGPLIGDAMGRMGEPLWPAYFLLQPALALGLAVVIGKILSAVSPATARVLSGGRLGRSKQGGVAKPN